MAATLRPIENWRKVLRHAWSVRFNVLGFALSAGAIVLPMMLPAVPADHLVFFGAITFAVIFGSSLASRFVSQSKINGDSGEP